MGGKAAEPQCGYAEAAGRLNHQREITVLEAERLGCRERKQQEGSWGAPMLGGKKAPNSGGSSARARRDRSIAVE